jgi:hypothetical protein
MNRVKEPGWASWWAVAFLVVMGAAYAFAAGGSWSVEQEQDNHLYQVALDGQKQFETKNLREAQAIVDQKNRKDYEEPARDYNREALQRLKFETENIGKADR